MLAIYVKNCSRLIFELCRKEGHVCVFHIVFFVTASSPGTVNSLITNAEGSRSERIPTENFKIEGKVMALLPSNTAKVISYYLYQRAWALYFEACVEIKPVLSALDCL